MVLPFCQGKAGVKEAKLKDGGFESEQGSTRGHNHALALPDAVFCHQLKQIWDEVEHKTQESTFANLGELLCPRPPPNGMEEKDLTPTSLLMRKLAIFISCSFIGAALDGNYGKLYFAVLVNGERLANLIASTKTDLHLTPHHRCSPCLCLWNNDHDDEDAAEAGADVETLGQVKVVLAGEAVRKVDSSHPLTLHHLRQQQIKFPIKKKETKKNL